MGGYCIILITLISSIICPSFNDGVIDLVFARVFLCPTSSFYLSIVSFSYEDDRLSGGCDGGASSSTSMLVTIFS